MQTLLWILAGGLIGWTSCAYIGYNAARGAVVSTLIGAIGALIGAEAIAPMFLAAPTPGEWNLPLAVFAAAAAAACLVLSDMLHQRWGV